MWQRHNMLIAIQADFLALEAETMQTSVLAEINEITPIQQLIWSS